MLHMQVTVSDVTSPNEQLLLRSLDDLIVEGRTVSYELLKRALSGHMSSDLYETTVCTLVKKGLLEIAYGEGFDLGLRKPKVVHEPT